MSIFDYRANRYFKEDYRGKTYFLPWGSLGKVYLLDDERRKKNIFRFMKWFDATFFLIILLIGVTIGWLFGIITLSFYYPIKYLKVRHWSRGLSSIKGKLFVAKE